jgi:cation diffusion facilitator family transporter
MTATRASRRPASAPSTQRGAVLTALVANLVVAGAKLGAFAITSSSALLAEALHSFADTANEVLLLVGARRATRPADLRHPFGHARYRYVYAFLVSLTVFWIGGVLAVVEGVSHLASNEPIVDPGWALAVLALGAALDGWSLRTTIRAGRSTKGTLTWKQLVRTTKAPELIVIFLEDLGALVGIAIATLGIVLALITRAPIWDAVASIAIGLLLMAIGLVVNRETQSLLLGESASGDVEDTIRAAIKSVPGIEAVVNLRTIHLGPDDLVVASGIVIDEAFDGAAIARAIVDAETRVRAALPFRTVIYLEPRLAITAGSAGFAVTADGAGPAPD